LFFEGKKGELASIPVGSVVKGKVTEVNALGVIGQLESGIKAVAVKDNMKGQWIICVLCW